MADEKTHGSGGATVDAPGKPGRDLLQQPVATVGIDERDEGAVAGVIGRGPC